MADDIDWSQPPPGWKSPTHNDDIDWSKPLPGANDQNMPWWERLASNIDVGRADMLHGLANAPYNITNAINPQVASYIPHMADVDYAKQYGFTGPASLSDRLIRGLAQFAPAILAPQIAVEEAPGVSAGVTANMAANAIPQAIFGATQTTNPIVGAVSGGVGGATTPLVSKLLNALRPSQLLRGNLSDAQLAANQEAARGTKTNIGDVIASPGLKGLYENILPHILGSGAVGTMQKTANQIKDVGQNLLENIQGSADTGNLGPKLQQALKTASAKATQEKNAGYKALNDAADSSGMVVGRENFSNKAQEILDQINESEELKRSISPELISDLESYSQNKTGNTLKNTNIFRGKIGDKADEAYMTPGKKFEGGVYSRLKEALGSTEGDPSDIGDAFNLPEHADIKPMYDEAQRNYAEKFAPFEDRDIVKFTRQGGDPDMLLPYFIRGGQNDRAVLASKLTDALSDEDKSLPLYSYLSKAKDESGEVNPIKLSNLYRKLGPNQKDALIKDDGVRSQLDKYSNLVGQNKEAFNLMYNPKTGARSTSSLIGLIQGGLGNAIGGIPGMIGTLAATAIPARGATKLLTSPNLRDKLVGAMLKNKPFNAPPETGGLLNALFTPRQDNNTGK